MSSITADYSTRVPGDYKITSPTPRTEAQVKAKIIEVQTENLKAIENGLDQNSAGRGDKVKIQVPADANGNPIYRPSAQDWENATKTDSFATVEDTPSGLATRFYGLDLVDLGNSSDNLISNKAFLRELQDALGKGITFPTTEAIPRSEVGDVARAFQARQSALRALERGMGNPNAGVMDPPRERVDIKVPADAKGNPIKNPSTKDWIAAQKNNRWATVSDKPENLASDYYGVKIDMANWRDSYKDNKAAFGQASQEGIQRFDSYIRQANGDFFIDAVIDIPDAGKILAEVFKVLGPAYNDQIVKANDLKEQMDSLRKKNDALQKLENSISDNNTSGSNSVDFDVPTKRYVYDSDGNKVLDSNGKPKTEAVGAPPSDQDWARAAEWKSVKELNGGKGLNGRDAANKYFGMQLSHVEGTNAHNINLSNNIQKIGNARTAVQSEMSKLSGQFDFYMGNAQTNLQNANKIIASVNDMMMGIARGI
jgi:hypothetical protein